MGPSGARTTRSRALRAFCYQSRSAGTATRSSIGLECLEEGQLLAVSFGAAATGQGDQPSIDRVSVQVVLTGSGPQLDWAAAPAHPEGSSTAQAALDFLVRFLGWAFRYSSHGLTLTASESVQQAVRLFKRFTR